MSLFSQALIITRKDLLLEWRGRSRIVSVLLFGVVTLLLFSFAVGPDSIALRASAAGFLVLALLLSSTLGLSESFRLEQEQLAIEGLMLLPVDPIALFYGKALSNTIFLMLLAPILIPIALVLYAVELEPLRVLGLLGLVGSLSCGPLGTGNTLRRHDEPPSKSGCLASFASFSSRDPRSTGNRQGGSARANGRSDVPDPFLGYPAG